MKKYLIRLADHLDKKGLHKEADYVDWVLKQAADEEENEKDPESENYPIDPEPTKRKKDKKNKEPKKDHHMKHKRPGAAG